MRVAVIGSGIAGMTAARLLHPGNDLTLFECEPRIGGHTHTVNVVAGGTRYAVDTGFIVHNDHTYPNFIQLLKRIGVPTQASDMSFSVSCARTGLEYNPQSLSALFAQRRNLVNPAFHRLVAQIVRFTRQARVFLRDGDPSLSLDDFLARHAFGPRFKNLFLVPMLSAIWSADPANVMAYPAVHFLRFFENHGLLNLSGGPTWRVITGGSARYAEALTRPYADRIRLATPVEAAWREADGVMLRPLGGAPERYDHVVLAVHSDTALRMLASPTRAERHVLGAIPYQRNEVTLHTDTRLLPRARRAWASWNYHVPAAPRAEATVTYHMNRLQGIDAPVDFCVSLNSGDRIDPEKVLRRFEYWHPMFSPEAIAAQTRHAEISGQGGIHFCGAYWGYGFHEDGVNSALAVARHFNRGLDDAKLPLPGARATSALHAG